MSKILFGPTLQCHGGIDLAHEPHAVGDVACLNFAHINADHKQARARKDETSSHRLCISATISEFDERLMMREMKAVVLQRKCFHFAMPLLD
jgi:hypothetical protein